MTNCLFETYKNYVTTHGCHIYQTVPDMDMETMCEYPQSQHALTRWKHVLSCCNNFALIDILIQEPDRHHFNKYTTISFHVYHLI